MSLQLQVRIRRDTASAWALNDPTLAAGEIAFEIDTYRLKVGTGSTPYSTLPYITGTGSGGAGISNLSQLLDVLISSPSDGDVLSYNQATGKWNNTPKFNITDGGNF